jgi:predicted AlkP superfamily phosphohydrolase/phosphomutase
MKICVLGLEGASPEVIFGDERLVNLRRLMDLGVYGRLQSEIPPSAVPAWMCMSTSQDPGSLGIYGFRDRTARAQEVDCGWGAAELSPAAH